MRPPFIKLRPFLVIALILICTSLSGCVTQIPTPPPIIESSPTAAPPGETSTVIPSQPTGSPAISTAVKNTLAARVLPRALYQIQVKLDYAKHLAGIQETITYWNTTPGPLSSLSFLVEPNRYPDSFELQSVSLDGQPVPNYTLEKNRLDLPLAQPAPPSAKLSIQLDFELHLPPIPPPSDTTRPIPYGYTNRQLNLVDWYPSLPPFTPGQGWLLHTPGYYGEHQVYDVADYQIDLTLVNAPPGIVVAASAPAQQDGASYHYRLDAARNFALSTSPSYKLSQKTVGGVTVLDYYFPFNPTAGEAALSYTADAVSLYTGLFGPYPHQTLSVVEADFLDGMEYDGLFFLSQGFYNLYDLTPKGYLTAISVHETAHQWWYGLVGNDQAEEPWLDEALATYTEKIFYEKTYPDLVDWWWGYRVKFFAPAGMINQPVYDYGGFLQYRNAVYLRGALFLDDLRKRIGDEAFFAFIKDYAAQEAHKISTRQDFFRILALHTQANLEDLIAAYFK